MATCPNCGKKLRLYQWRPECPACGVNMVYFKSNERLLAAFKGALGRKMEYKLPEANKDMAE